MSASASASAPPPSLLTGTYPHAHAAFAIPASMPSDASPALRIEANSLASCFAFLLISEKLMASGVCKYWYLVGQSRQSWKSTFFFPATSSRLLRLPVNTHVRIDTLDAESIMDECTARFERADQEQLEEGEDGKETEQEQTEESSDDQEDEDMPQVVTPLSASELIAALNAVSDTTSSRATSFRCDALWLRLLRHFRRFTRLSTFTITSVRNNDAAQILDSLTPTRDTLTTLSIAGCCHPLRTGPLVKEWRGLAQFKRLTSLAFPYTLGAPMMHTLIQHTISLDTTSDVNPPRARMEFVDEEAASTLSKLLPSWGVPAEALASAASSPAPAQLVVSFVPSMPICTFGGIKILSLKLWRSVYLVNDSFGEEMTSRAVEHICLRQLIAHLPLLARLKVLGMSDERCLTSIACNPRLSPNLTSLTLGFHGQFNHRAWKDLECLATAAPKLVTLVLRCAIPNIDASMEDEDDEEESKFESAVDLPRRTTMNTLMLASISRLISLTSISLHLTHSVDEAAIAIIYPRFFTPEELSPLRDMPKLQSLETEIVTRRTSTYLSRSFNPTVLPSLFQPHAHINETLTNLTLFSPCLRDLVVLDQLKALKQMKLISTCAKIILKQKRKIEPSPPPMPPPFDDDLPDDGTDTEVDDSDDYPDDEYLDHAMPEFDAQTEAAIAADLEHLENVVAEEEARAASGSSPADLAVSSPPAAIASTSISTSSPSPASTVTASSNNGDDDDSSSDDEHDENTPRLPRSAEQIRLHAECRSLEKRIRIAEARQAGLPPPMPRSLYFTNLPKLENLVLSNIELYAEDFRTLAAQPELTHLQLNRCYVGKFRLPPATNQQPIVQKAAPLSIEEQKEPTAASAAADALAAETAACFTLLAAASKLVRLSHAPPDSGGPTIGFLPPLHALRTLTSLTITNWARVSTSDLQALHSLTQLRHLGFFLAEFTEAQMPLLLPPFVVAPTGVASSSVIASPRRQRAAFANMSLVGCGVLTPAEEAVRLASGYTAPAYRDSSRHNSATPRLTCAPLYAWKGLATFLDDCFEAGISVKHKRYY